MVSCMNLYNIALIINLNIYAAAGLGKPINDNYTWKSVLSVA
jgi:hypothetical protein